MRMSLTHKLHFIFAGIAFSKVEIFVESAFSNYLKFRMSEFYLLQACQIIVSIMHFLNSQQ